MFRYTIALILLPIVLGGVVDVRPCQGLPKPQQVRIDGCDKQPCKLIRGQDIDVETDFAAAEYTEKLDVKILTTALGVTVPYEMPEDRRDACDWLIGSQCPLEKGEDVTYNMNMPVLRIYPKVKLVIQVSLVDQLKNIPVCFSVDCVVVDN